MATNKRTLSRIGFYCGLALFLIITLFPFFVMLMTSFKGAKEAISLHPTLLPQQWTLEHYVDIFNPMIFPFVDYFRNSLVVSVVSSVVAVFLGILGAYALSRLRFKGRMTINASFYTVYMFSGILLVVPLFKIITALGIYDTEMALIITMVTQTLPTAVFMLKSYFDTIPDEIEEAAMMDGLNRLQIIFRITVPLAMSGLISVFVYCFMVAWNDYLFASTSGCHQQHDFPRRLSFLRSSFSQLRQLSGSQIQRQRCAGRKTDDQLICGPTDYPTKPQSLRQPATSNLVAARSTRR